MEVTREFSFDDTTSAFSYRSHAALIRARLIFSILNKPLLSSLLIGITKLALYLRLPIVVLIIKKTIFYHFCGGETAVQCKKTVDKLADYNVKTVLDYSVEEEKTEEGFNKTMKEILHTLELSRKTRKFPFCVFKITGIADSTLLEKVEKNLTLTTSETSALGAVKKRLDTLCAHAHKHRVPLLVDAENSWFQNTLDAMVYDMMRRYNREKAILFNTFQMYRVGSLNSLQHAHKRATEQGYFLGVKIVRGAYMETERKRASEMGYPTPILPDKENTDTSFDTGLEFCIQNIAQIELVCASHNEASNQYLTQLMKQHKIQEKDNRIWFLQLHGMRDNISFELAGKGYNVGKYIPYGPVRSVMPYLMRRVRENTSVAGQSSRELELIRKELNRRKTNNN